MVVEGDAAEQIRAAIRRIGRHAHATNLDRSARLKATFEVAANGSLSDSEREAAAELAHQLVGSAGTFGFPEVSQLAAELESFFADRAYGNPERVATARVQLLQLEEELAHEPSYTDGT